MICITSSETKSLFHSLIRSDACGLTLRTARAFQGRRRNKKAVQGSSAQFREVQGEFRAFQGRFQVMNYCCRINYGWYWDQLLCGCGAVAV